VKTYIVTRKSDGQERYRYQHTEPVEWAGFEFATHDHTEAPPPPAPPPPPPEDRRITLLAFRNRFSPNEKVGLEIAALDVPTAPMDQRAMAASLRASMKDQEVALWIDLTRTETRVGVQQLEGAGLIAPGRAAAILDGPITEIERYRERV
jgi:hypothetical protein